MVNRYAIKFRLTDITSFVLWFYKIPLNLAQKNGHMATFQVPTFQEIHVLEKLDTIIVETTFEENILGIQLKHSESAVNSRATS